MTAASTIPLWGRAWELTVFDGNGNPTTLTQSSWDPEALRMTFDVLQAVIDSPYWFADIAIYNLNKPTAQNILLNAQWVVLKAGYQAGNSGDGSNTSGPGIIWIGPVLQVTFDKENVVDQIIRLNCVSIAGRNPDGTLIQESMINTANGILKSQKDVIASLIAISNSGDPGAAPLTPDQMNAQVGPLAQQRFAAKEYPRGKTFFGTVSRYIAQTSNDAYVNYWRGMGGQHFVSELIDPSKPLTPDVVFGPPYPPGYTPSTPTAGITRSIIGVPKQTVFGCIFKVLLDPRLIVNIPPMLVQLDQTLIEQLQIQIGQLPPARSILTQGGLYVVGQVRHYGDTRANDWYSEVSAYSTGWAQNLFDGIGAALAAGAQ